MFRTPRLLIPFLLLIAGMVFLAAINSGQAFNDNSIRHISLPAKDLIFDSNTQKIYASVPSSVNGVGNSITRIDPVTGATEASIHVGSDPGKLAISGDKQFLYVGLDGATAVRRFALATQTAELLIPLGNSPANGAFFAHDIEVMPGAPQSIVISRRHKNLDPDHAGVAVFDNAVQRPTVTNVNIGMPNSIEFSSSAATLYGASDRSSSFLFRLSVTAEGVSIANSIPGLSNSPGTIEFDNGLLYHTLGRVVDPEAQTIVGTYPGLIFNPFFGRSLVVDSANNRVYFLAGGATEPNVTRASRLLAFDKTTFTLIGQYDIPDTVGRVSSLIQWSPTGLAFRDQNRIYLVPTPTAGPAPSPTPTPSPTSTPTPTPGPGELREISLATNDLVYSTSTQSLYASVPSSAGPVGNSVTLINPVAGTVGTSVVVGSEPNKLAISDDGQEIHVSLDGATAIRRFHVATQTAGLQFSVPSNVGDMAAMPGNPNTIATASGSTLVTIYDNGIPRALTHNFGRVTNIAFSKSPEVLYGYDTSSSSFEFSNMVVGSCGVGLAKVIGELIQGNVSDIKHDNGRVYASNGHVIDPESFTLLGTFFVPTFSALVEPDSKANRIYSLTTEGSTTTLRVFDLQTLTPIGVLHIPGVTGTPVSLVRWGTDGLAFNTPTKVFLLQNPMIGVPAPFTPAPAPSPSSFTARGTILQLNTPVDDVTITFTGSRNGTTQTGADGKFAIGELPLCGSLTITPSKTNWTFTPSSITLTNPNQTANFSAFHRIIGFVQTQVSVSESASKVFLAVQRSAGLPPTTTDVEFSSTNGTASDRSDYTAAIGTFHFDVQTGQAPIEVLLTDDVFVEGPETFTVTLEPVPGFDLVNPTVTVTINDNDVSPPVTNPVDSSVFFVRQHYHDFLNRDPDNAGLAFWVNEIENCAGDKQCRDVKRIHVSAAFFLSIEFQETGYLAYRMYKVAFGDSTSPNVSVPVPIIRLREFLHDAAKVGHGIQVGVGDWQTALEENKVQYTREFVLTPRFLAAFPLTMTPEQFVDKLDQNAGGVLSTAERNTLISELTFAADQSQGRASVTRKVADDADLRQREFNRAFVLLQYYGYLRRNPDDPQDTDFQGWQFWLNKLNQFNGNFVDSEMVKAFLLSTEYRQRFGPP